MDELVKMTAEEKAEFESFRKAKEEEARKARARENRDTYKAIVDETINEVFPSLQEVSDALVEKKKGVYDTFQKALVMKADIYEVRPDQQSNTFTNSAGNRRITLGQYATDDYDDTVNEGIEKVRQYIGSLAKDQESKMLVDAIMRLLSRDKKGNLKASRVMQLRKMSEESGSEMFIDGVRIIEEAYRPSISKYYVKAEFKNELGAWVNIPLGMTEA
jgi:hypothetical protein